MSVVNWYISTRYNLLYHKICTCYNVLCRSVFILLVIICECYREIYIIGGWLQSGPSAGNDVHRFNVDTLSWLPTPHSDIAPKCNMHTAEYIDFLNIIVVFRGGDGREYLNELHAYDVGG